MAIPTETVYGLAAPINEVEKLKRIFELKERPLFDPLIIHVSDKIMAKKYCQSWPDYAEKLADKFWPGPLTMVLEKNEELVNDLITAGRKTVGLRCPNHYLSLDLISQMGIPLAAPSANKFTKTSPSKADHVKRSFSEKDVYVLDGGDCEVGIESTIVKVEHQKLTILRSGMITSDDLAKVLGDVEIDFGVTALDDTKSEKIESPGQYHKHYCPDFPLLMGEKVLEEISDEDLKNFGFSKNNGEQRVLEGDPFVAARNLYSLLRTKISPDKKFLYLKIPTDMKQSEIWRGVLDRLQKASIGFIE